MKLTLIKQLNHSFKLAFDSDLEKAKKLKQGEQYYCEIKRPRNIKFHNKFFALLNMVFENQEKYLNKDDMREELTKAAGFYRTYINHKGIKCYKAESISFEKMDEDQFNEFYKRFEDQVVYIFGFDYDLIEENLKDYRNTE